MKPCLQHEFSVEQTQSNLDLALSQANTYLSRYLQDNIPDQHLKEIHYSIKLVDVRMDSSNWSSNRNYRYNFVADFNIGDIAG